MECNIKKHVKTSEESLYIVCIRVFIYLLQDKHKQIALAIYSTFEINKIDDVLFISCIKMKIEIRIKLLKAFLFVNLK